MLTLTPIASEAIRRLAPQASDDESAGIRIAPGPVTEQGPALELALVPAGEPSDRTIDDHGAHVYIEPAVAEVLDEMVLDADVREGRVTFLVREPDLSAGDHPAPTPNGNGPTP